MRLLRDEVRPGLRYPKNVWGATPYFSNKRRRVTIQRAWGGGSVMNSGTCEIREATSSLGGIKVDLSFLFLGIIGLSVVGESFLWVDLHGTWGSDIVRFSLYL